MGDLKSQELWKLARRQHGVISHAQLRAGGLARKAVKHRVATGRLYRVHRGVYAVGRPDLTRHGRWMAAVLACGHGAVLSHGSAAALLEIHGRDSDLSISVPSPREVHRPGIRVHRARILAEDTGTFDRIPVTSPARTLIDLATLLPTPRLEAAINSAAVRNLIHPEALRRELARRPGQRGVRALRDVLDRHAFRLTDSELERWFLPIARRARLPLPETRVWLHGFRVDFIWRAFDLVVETDGGRFHRTAIQQTRDRRREHALGAAGYYVLRFTHFQVRYEPAHVASTLQAVAAQRAAVSELSAAGAGRVA